jgi:hypothetical protein
MFASVYRYYDKYILFKDGMANDYLVYIKNRGIVFDENGIPMGMRPRGRRAGQDVSTYVYNPVAVANHGLFLYNDLIEHTDRLALGVDKSAAFTNQIRWLIESRTDKENMSFWYHNYPVVELDCRPPWKSALTQGLALSLLLRAYHLAESEEVSKVAERVANSMRTSTRDGGFLYIDEKGDYWYQEYMGNFGYVLNGFIFAMWGVYDYYLFSKDERYKVIFDKCVDTLRRNLRRYDWRMGIAKWTVYDLKDRNPATLTYQKLHVSLLKDLYAITRQKFLSDCANRWEGYIQQPNVLLVSLGRHARAQVLELFKVMRIECSHT